MRQIGRRAQSFFIRCRIGPNNISIMLLFAASIFLSAFLLFQIQPMIGKFILPWFGGTPAVWSTVIASLLPGGGGSGWGSPQDDQRRLRGHRQLDQPL